MPTADGTHPTYADLDAQVRALHREVGELHLVVARALDGRVEALLREAAARRGQVEAVDRVRAVLDAWRDYGSDSANGVRRLVAELDETLDGPAVASDG